MWKAKSDAPKPAEEKTPSALEERLEYTTVTDFRQSLLGMLRQLEENEDLRFIITRHGEPCAVVLSHEAYQLLRRIARRSADIAAGKEREQRLDEAFLRMAREEAAGPGAYEPLLDENYLHAIIRKATIEGIKHELKRRATAGTVPISEDLAKSNG